MAQDDGRTAKVRGRAAKRAAHSRQGEAEHGDTCRCDGCINVNYPRSRAVIHAELRAICREHCSAEMNAWLDREFPLAGEQLELFR